MKKTYSSPSISIAFQLLGMLINGMVGNTLELVAHLIDTFYENSSTKVFFQKFIIIVLSQITINWIFADHSMAADMTLCFVEKNYKTVWIGIQFWLAVGNIIRLVKIFKIRKSLLAIVFAIFQKSKIYQNKLKVNNFVLEMDCS